VKGPTLVQDPAREGRPLLAQPLASVHHGAGLRRVAYREGRQLYLWCVHARWNTAMLAQDRDQLFVLLGHL